MTMKRIASFFLVVGLILAGVYGLFWVYCEYFCEKSQIQAKKPAENLEKKKDPKVFGRVPLGGEIRKEFLSDSYDVPAVQYFTRLKTPRFMREYDRTLYDTPHAEPGKSSLSGYWGLLRAAYPEIEVWRKSDIQRLKEQSAEVAREMEQGPSETEINSMRNSEYDLDSAHLVYIAQVLDRDIIVSSNIGPGFDLFTENGETFHYDTLEEIAAEANRPETIWLHNINQRHWVVALPNSYDLDDDDSDDDEPREHRNVRCIVRDEPLPTPPHTHAPSFL